MKQEKTLLIIALLLGLGLVFTAPGTTLATDTYKVDPVHAFVNFRINHLNIGYSYGRFNRVSGTLVLDEATAANNKIDITVNADSLDTDNTDRDKHIKAPDFLDAGKFSTIRFVSKSMKKVGASYEVSGELTLRGVTKPLNVVAVKTGEGKDPWGAYRIAFETTFAIKRSDFGIDFMLSGVGDTVMLTVSIEAIRQ